MTKAVTTTQPQQNALVAAFTNEMQGYLQLLPKDLPRDRFKQFVLEALMNPELQRCSVDSVIVSVMKSAQAALPIDGVHSAIVPFKGVATFVPMYKGVLQLVRRTNKIRQVWAELVFEGDEFDWDPVERKVKHRLGSDKSRVDPDKVTNAYACFRWHDGFVDTEVMTRDELDRVWKSSPAQNGPWKSHRLAMYKKTVVRRGAKMLPLPDEVLMALQADEYDEEAPREAEVVDDGRKPPTTLQGLVDRAKAQKAQVPQVAASGDPGASQEATEAQAPRAATRMVFDAQGDPHDIPLPADLPAFEFWEGSKIGGTNETLKDRTWRELADGASDLVKVARVLVPAIAKAAAAGQALSPGWQRIVWCLARLDEPVPQEEPAGGEWFGGGQ